MDSDLIEFGACNTAFTSLHIRIPWLKCYLVLGGSETVLCGTWEMSVLGSTRMRGFRISKSLLRLDWIRYSIRGCTRGDGYLDLQSLSDHPGIRSVQNHFGRRSNESSAVPLPKNPFQRSDWLLFQSTRTACETISSFIDGGFRRRGRGNG